MLLLMLFALIAGAGTAITPCVLPVLPALLAASAAGGRRRPIGIVVGLALTFTIAIVALAQLVNGVGPRERRRADAGDRRPDRVRRRAADPGACRARRRRRCRGWPGSDPKTRGDGFWSGLGVGGGARVRVRAVRRADPGRGDVGQRLERRHRAGGRGRDRLRGRPVRGAAALRASAAAR